MSTSVPFTSIDEAHERLLAQGYIPDRRISTVVYLSARMQKPILVEGPAGVGKTELSKALSGALAVPLIRLQCYEGLDETKAMYEWEYAKQLLYTQILRDKIGETLREKTLRNAIEEINKEGNVFFSDKFILPRPLLKAITSDTPCVLLIDEVDRSDPEFEAFLLEILSDFQVSIPELGTIKARHIPYVILTSNNTREMSDALKRRCLHLFIDFPEKDLELKIVRLRIPEISAVLAEQVVSFVQKVRKLDIKKLPSVSETLDWARALSLMNVDVLGEAVVRDTLNLILKHEEDVKKAQEELKKLLAQERPAAVPREISPHIH